MVERQGVGDVASNPKLARYRDNVAERTGRHKERIKGRQQPQELGRREPAQESHKRDEDRLNAAIARANYAAMLNRSGAVRDINRELVQRGNYANYELAPIYSNAQRKVGETQRDFAEQGRRLEDSADREAQSIDSGHNARSAELNKEMDALKALRTELVQLLSKSDSKIVMEGIDVALASLALKNTIMKRTEFGFAIRRAELILFGSGPALRSYIEEKAAAGKDENSGVDVYTQCSDGQQTIAVLDIGKILAILDREVEDVRTRISTQGQQRFSAQERVQERLQEDLAELGRQRDTKLQEINANALAERRAAMLVREELSDAQIDALDKKRIERESAAEKEFVAEKDRIKRAEAMVMAQFDELIEQHADLKVVFNEILETLRKRDANSNGRNGSV